MADWDGDGQKDLLVGAGDGSVTLFRNTGTATAPELAAGVTLVPKGEVEYGADAPREPRRGVRAKVCATDWDGDGRLDLLLGDFATQKPDRPEPTPEQRPAGGWFGGMRERMRGIVGKANHDQQPGLAGVMVDAFNITQDRISRSRLAGDPPDVMIGPKLGRVGLFDFHRADEAIALGRQAAERALDEIAAIVAANHLPLN